MSRYQLKISTILLIIFRNIIANTSENCSNFKDLLIYLRAFNNVFIDKGDLPELKRLNIQNKSDNAITIFDIFLLALKSSYNESFNDFNRKLQTYNQCGPDEISFSESFIDIRITFNLLHDQEFLDKREQYNTDEMKKQALKVRETQISRMKVDSAILSQLISIFEGPVDPNDISSSIDLTDEPMRHALTNLFQPISRKNSISMIFQSQDSPPDQKLIRKVILDSYSKILYADLNTSHYQILSPIIDRILKHASILIPLIDIYNQETEESAKQNAAQKIASIIVDKHLFNDAEDRLIGENEKQILKQVIKASLHSSSLDQKQFNFLYICLILFKNEEKTKCPTDYINFISYAYQNASDNSDLELQLILKTFHYTISDLIDEKVINIDSNSNIKDMSAIVDTIQEYETKEFSKRSFETMKHFITDYFDKRINNEILRAKYDSDSFNQDLKSFLRPFKDFNHCPKFKIRDSNDSSTGVYYAILMTRIFNIVKNDKKLSSNIDRLLLVLSDINLANQYNINGMNINKVKDIMISMRNPSTPETKPVMTEKFMKSITDFVARLWTGIEDPFMESWNQSFMNNEMQLALFVYVSSFMDDQVSDFNEFVKKYENTFDISQLTDENTRDFKLASHAFFKILQSCDFVSSGRPNIKNLADHLILCRTKHFSKIYSYETVKGLISKMSDEKIFEVKFFLNSEESFDTFNLMAEFSRSTYYPQVKSFENFMTLLTTSSLKDVANDENQIRELKNFYQLLKMYDSQPESLKNSDILDKKLMSSKEASQTIFNDLMTIRDVIMKERTICANKLQSFFSAYLDKSKYDDDRVKSTIESQSGICKTMLFEIVRKLPYVFGSLNTDEFKEKFYDELSNYFGKDYDKQKIQELLRNFYLSVESFLYDSQDPEVNHLDAKSLVDFLIEHRSSTKDSNRNMKIDNNPKIDMDLLRDFLSKYLNEYPPYLLVHFELFTKYFESDEKFVQNFKSFMFIMMRNVWQVESIDDILANLSDSSNSGHSEAINSSDKKLLSHTIQYLRLNDTEIWLNISAQRHEQLYRWLAMSLMYGKERQTTQYVTHLVTVAILLVLSGIMIFSMNYLLIFCNKKHKNHINFDTKPIINTNKQDSKVNQQEVPFETPGEEKDHKFNDDILFDTL